jgi:hypothetical protein
MSARTVRKMLTLPELGSVLLDRAAGSGKGRVQGEYLATLMRQAQQRWRTALAMLDSLECDRDEIRLACESLQGYEPSLADKAGAIAARVRARKLSRVLSQNPIASLALCELIEAYSTGDLALRTELGGNT